MTHYKHVLVDKDGPDNFSACNVNLDSPDEGHVIIWKATGTHTKSLFRVVGLCQAQVREFIMPPPDPARSRPQAETGWTETLA